MLGPRTIRIVLGFLAPREAPPPEAMITGIETGVFLSLLDIADLRMPATVVEGTGIGRAWRRLGSPSQAAGMAGKGTETTAYPLGTLIRPGPEALRGTITL